MNALGSAIFLGACRESQSASSTALSRSTAEVSYMADEKREQVQQAIPTGQTAEIAAGRIAAAGVADDITVLVVELIRMPYAV